MAQWNLKRALTTLIIAGFVGGMLYYVYYQSRGIISGPQISVISPQNGETIRNPLVHVYGTTKRAKQITLDGREIFIDLEGNFGEELLLAPGYNIIELAARDAEGHNTKKILEVVYYEDASQAGSSTSVFHSDSKTPSATGSRKFNN